MSSIYRFPNIDFRTLCKAIKSFVLAAIAINMVAFAYADDLVSHETNYSEVVVAINETMRAFHYDSAELDAPGYKRVEAAVTALAETATSDKVFVEGFRDIWKNGPFSHVELRTAKQSADDLAAHLDTIRAFWTDVQDKAITRMSFSPADPVFDGPVYILTSKRTASAAELAIDVLKSSNRAIVIGETTAGEMLSQKIYDLPGGFHLSLPIADYYSAVNGRIEGVGVKPHKETDAASALHVALPQQE